MSSFYMNLLSKSTPRLKENSPVRTISGIKKVAENTYEISLTLKKRNFSFIPGQYLHLTIPHLLDHDPRGNSRDFSISSSPKDKYITFTTRASDSAFKRTLLSGTAEVDITGPFGVFTLPPEPGPHIVMIAGGIGIAPFFSMLKFSAQKKLPDKITLLYVNKDRAGTPYLDELNKIQKKNNNISIKVIYTPITRELIQKEVFDPKAQFFIAGAPRMVYKTRIFLEDLGISQTHINTEEFSGYQDKADIPQNHLILKTAEAQLLKRSIHDLEALLMALSNSAIVSETNAAGTITYANDKFIEISKYSREELIGQNHRILKSGEHSKAYFENLWATISRGRVWRGVLKNRAKDGSFYWVDSSIAPILGKNGVPVKYISVRFLVTERQQAEEALRETIKQQHVLAVLSQEALVNTDINSLFSKTLNLLKKTLCIELAAILKFQPGSNSLLFLTGLGFNTAVEGKTTIHAQDDFSMAGYTLANKTPTVVSDLTTETRFVGSNLLHDHNARSGVSVIIHGSDHPFGILQIFSKNIRLFSGVETSFIQSVANLLANAARNQLDKRKDEFLGIASHEIKTPLTSIKTFAQLLNRHASRQKDENALLFLNKIEQQINKMMALITDLLDISRINSGRMDYNDELFPVIDIVRETIGDIQLITKKHKIILENKIKHKIYGDKLRIGQVLYNLLTNAVKYSPGGDKIIIKMKEESGQVIVSIQDFGIGIPRKDRELIFSRFYKGNGRRSRHFPGGLGLGLYISSEIVKRHNGRIWVESARGKGSKFYFSLPLKNNQE